MSADEQPKTRKSGGRPLGPIGEAVRANIKTIREGQGMSQNQLAANMTRLGRPIPSLGIHRIEAGDRRVDVDDLIALAVALTTTPASLLMPKIGTVGPDDQVKLLDDSPTVSAIRAWQWITGRARISRVRFSAFISRSWPGWEQDAYESDRVEKWEQTNEELAGQLWPAQEATDGDD